MKATECVIGSHYNVKCGIWELSDMVYVGSEDKKYRFTCGNLENWKNQYCILAPKSRLKIEPV